MKRHVMHSTIIGNPDFLDPSELKNHKEKLGQYILLLKCYNESLNCLTHPIFVQNIIGDFYLQVFNSLDYGRIIDFQTEVAIGLAIIGTLSAYFALYQRASKNGVNYARKSVP